MMARWMTGISLLAGSLGLALAVPVPAEEEPRAEKAEAPKEAKNLVVNGDFEQGDDSPTGWQQVDGLTTFWVKDEDPKRGKVLEVDTDVYQAQAYEWWTKIAKRAKAREAPKKTPTVGDKYDTLAGLDGVWFWSDFIPVQKGQAYWLTIDVKGSPDVMAWLVGYEKKESTAFGADANAFQEYLKEKLAGKPKENKRLFEGFINKYTWRGQLNNRYAKPLPGGWRRMTRDKLPFRPTKVTPKVRFVRVLILPYWPPGICYIDNVRLTEIEDKEASE
jgi:hypothetical protein